MVTPLAPSLPACEVALLMRGRHGIVEVGSSICVRLGGAYLLATAGHNLRGIERASQIRVVPLGRYRGDPVRPIAFGRAAAQGAPDVGWLELSPTSVDRAGLQAIDLSALGRRQRKRQGNAGDCLWIRGFPSSWVDHRAISATHFRLRVAHLSSRKIRPEPSTVGYRQRTDMAVVWPAAACGTSTEEELAFPRHPRGLSGSGIFASAGRPLFGPLGGDLAEADAEYEGASQRGESHPATETLAQYELDGGEPVRLLALARAFNRQRGLLFCTRIEHWLERIRHDRPDLMKNLSGGG